MAYKFNPFTGTLDYYLPVPAETDPVFTAWLATSPLAAYLKLDQSTPQTVTASPILDWGTDKRIPFYSGTKTLTDDDHFIWDAATERLGIGTGSPAGTLHTYRYLSSRDGNATHYRAQEYTDWLGAVGNVWYLDCDFTDYRRLNSGTTDHVYLLDLTYNRNSAATLSTAINSYVDAFPLTIIDNANFTATDHSYLTHRGGYTQISQKYKVNLTAGKNLTYIGVGYDTYLNSNAPTVTTGNLNAYYYSFRAAGVGHTAGTHKGYAFYNSMTGFGELWCLYNNTGASSVLGLDSSKQYLGTAYDASIYYDGTNLVINPQEVGSGATVFSAGNVGIGTIGPDAKLDVLATTEQFRLTYTDGSVYTSFITNSSGNLTISPSGGNIGLGVAATTGIGVNASKTFILSGATGERFGIQNRPTFSATIDQTTSVQYGLSNGLFLTGSYDYNLVYGMQAFVRHDGDASSTVARADGYNIQVGVGSNGGIITDLRGIAISSFKISGTITTLYGLKIENLTHGGTNYSIYTGTAQSYFGGNIIQPDNIKHILGTANDASIYYDATNLVINPKEVGSGILDVLGVIQSDGYNSSDGTAGATGTITLAAITTITVKNGLITAWS